MNAITRFLLLSSRVALLLACVVLPCAAEDPPQLLLVWGSRGSAPGQFVHPYDIKTAADGHVYVTDTENMRVQEFSSNGHFISQLLSGTGGAAFGFTHSCVVDNAGNLFVQDANGLIDVFDASRQFIRSWPSPAVFLALDPTGTVLYVNTFSDSIIKYDAATGERLTAWHYFSGQSWHGFAVGASGAVYISSSVYVQKYSSDGTLLAMWGGLGSGPGQFGAASGVTVDQTENVYVIDSGNARIQKFTLEGVFLSSWASSAPDQVSHGVVALAADDAGDIFALDFNLNRVLKFGYRPTAVRTRSWAASKQLSVRPS
jgi:DNA-binding beta-propeller fold protein YncE